MLIVIVRDNENNRWKTEKAQNKKKDRKEQQGGKL